MAMMENEMTITLQVTDSKPIALNASGQTKIRFSAITHGPITTARQIETATSCCQSKRVAKKA